ncbi:MAG: MMPL family transporter, partial [Phycisphaeraceae bacterium]
MHEHLRHRILGWWARLISRRPRWVLFVAIAAAVASIAVAISHWEFQSNRNDLISPDLEWNQRFIDWQTNFPGSGDLIVVVDTCGPDGRPTDQAAQRARAFVDELGPRLNRENEHIQRAVWGFDPAQVRPRAMRLLPMQQFEQRLRRMRQAEPLLTSPTPQDLIHRTVAELQQQAGGAIDEADAAASLHHLTRFIDAAANSLAAEPDQPIDFAAMAANPSDATTWNYLASRNNRLLFIRITPWKEQGALSALGGAIKTIRGAIADVSLRHPGVEVGLTGNEVMEADETAAAMRDSMLGSIVAAVLITLLLVSAFHSWRVPLLLMVALLVGIAWTFGYLTVAVGHLQIISVVFTVILLGLGVAFGIHLASRFELVRHAYPDTSAGFADALRDTFEHVGPAVVTGAITTAAAFCMTLLTDFKGVAEMGLIAAAGIILCLISMFSVFPALLRIYKRRHRHLVKMEHRLFHFFEERWISPFTRRPKTTLLVIGLLSAASLLAITRLRFDYDLLKLQPRGVDSIEWQRRIAEDGGESIWFGVSVAADFNEARRRAVRFMQKDTVASVGGVGLLFPRDEQRKIELVRATRQKIGDALNQALHDNANGLPSPEPDLINALQNIRGTLALRTMAGGTIPATIAMELDQLGRAIDRVLSIAAGLSPAQREIRLGRLRDQYQRFRAQTAG